MEGKIKIMVLCASGMSSGLVVDSIIEHALNMGGGGVSTVRQACVTGNWIIMGWILS